MNHTGEIIVGKYKHRGARWIFSLKKGILKRMHYRMRHILGYPVTKTCRLMRRMRPETWICRGREIRSGYPLSIFYAGSDQPYRNYLAELAFGGTAEQKYLGRRWIWRIPICVSTEAPQCALLAMESDCLVDRIFQNRRAITMPRWVEAVLDISMPIERVFPKKAYKEMKRIVGKNGYSYEVTRDENRFHDFYSGMYMPYVRGRFEDTAYVLSPRWYETLTKHSELLYVTTKTDIIAGVLIEYTGHGALLGYIGFKDGNEKYMKEGAQNAIIYFSVQWLQKKGYQKVSLGPSKSFLNDGRMKSKMLKGASMSDKVFAPDENLSLQVLHKTQGLKQFFIHNPFVFYPEKRARHAAFFLEAGRELTEKEIGDVFAPYRNYRGIDNWHLFTFGKIEKDGEGIHFPPPADMAVTISSAETFLS